MIDEFNEDIKMTIKITKYLKIITKKYQNNIFMLT